MKYPYRLSDEADIQRIMESLERERKRIAGEQTMLVRGMHRTNITCTGFMQANPDVQLAYAQHNGFFPNTGEDPDYDE
jgi:hypothetical protein